MINGTHFVLFSNDADADRAFVQKVLGFKFVTLDHGWLIFALPASELAVHPIDGGIAPGDGQEGMSSVALYFMCDDLDAEIERLAQKGARFGKVESAPWGRHTTIQLPSGGAIGLYQPDHETALGL